MFLMAEFTNRHLTGGGALGRPLLTRNFVVCASFYDLMKILYTILLCCFCLCIPTRILATEHSSSRAVLTVHAIDATGSFLSDVELYELEELEDPMPEATEAPYEHLDPSKTGSSAQRQFADHEKTNLSETPRYIRLRHLII